MGSIYWSWWVVKVMAKIDYTPETIDQLQDELISLLVAWADRGIPPADSCMLLGATSHMMIMQFTDYKFSEFMEIAKAQWVKNGGKL